jgi:glycosyltransferase involved in cell wall biosynthesis
MKLLVAIPALNEARSISLVIEQVKVAQPTADILVIDDGSTDQTAQVAKAAGAVVLSLPFNLGVGGALRSGFVYASRNDYTHLVQVDADGQHDPEQISNLIVASTDFEIVVGSRFANGREGFKVSGARNLAMKWLAFWMSRICKVRLTDVTSGFRIATRPAIELFAREYPPEYLGDTVESLVLGHRAGMRITEIPVVMNQRMFGTSSQSAPKALWYTLRASLVLLLAVLHQPNSNSREAK